MKNKVNKKLQIEKHIKRIDYFKNENQEENY